MEESNDLCFKYVTEKTTFNLTAVIILSYLVTVPRNCRGASRVYVSEDPGVDGCCCERV